jgi:hypothetical protein
MRPGDAHVTERGGAGEAERGRVVSVRRAVSGRVRSGRREEEGRSGRASGRLGWGAPGARNEPGQPVSGSRYDILRAGGWEQKLYLTGECQILRKTSPSFSFVKRMENKNSSIFECFRSGSNLVFTFSQFQDHSSCRWDTLNWPPLHPVTRFFGRSSGPRAG